MRRLILVVLAVGACEQGEASYPDPAGTGGKITVGGSNTPDTDSGSSSDSSGAGTGSSDSSGDSSSSGGLMCAVSGETCDDDGVCIEVGTGWACGHREPGEPCELPAHCKNTKCLAQPPSIDIPGVCTGDSCERIGAACDGGVGTCIADPMGRVGSCSHGLPGEPCITDADCDENICQEYAVEGGTVLLCREPAPD